MKKGQLSARSLEIGFEDGLGEEVTAYAGAALLVEAARLSGVIAAADRALPAKKNPKGLTHGQMVESLVLLSSLGGECPDDLQTLRQDRGLEAMLGYQLPAPSTVRAWLDQFHDDEAMAGRPSQGSFIPQESARLAGLPALGVAGGGSGAPECTRLCSGDGNPSAGDDGRGRPSGGVLKAGSSADL